MEEEILRNLPSNWNVFIINGNAPHVPIALRKQIQKMHPEFKKKSNTKPMLVLFYFSDGYIRIPKCTLKKKNSICHNSNNIIMKQISEKLVIPIDQPIEEVSAELDIEERSRSIDNLVTPIGQLKQDISNKLDVKQQSNNQIMLESIENLVTSVAESKQEISNDFDAIHIFSPISKIQIEEKLIHAHPQHHQSFYQNSQTIINDFENLQIKNCSRTDVLSPPPPVMLPKTTTTNEFYDNNNIFHQNVIDGDGNENNEVENDNEPMWISIMRAENEKILNKWNEKVNKLAGKVELIKKQLNDASNERDKVKHNLEKKLNDKILEYKSMKSNRLKSKKKSIKISGQLNKCTNKIDKPKTKFNAFRRK